eukprot:TRINITY_DN776052_c0_g1_i1.p1 TRINITY_DN776052_c0_g1~~TRINITY_DN776052_c0_g1_i1.p1  ORF type:complete len:466 (+),score=163.44 TRINITY_DN776052_c0_g1_i1:27-1400(+)
MKRNTIFAGAAVIVLLLAFAQLILVIAFKNQWHDDAFELATEEIGTIVSQTIQAELSKSLDVYKILKTAAGNGYFALEDVMSEVSNVNEPLPVHEQYRHIAHPWFIEDPDLLGVYTAFKRTDRRVYFFHRQSAAKYPGVKDLCTQDRKWGSDEDNQRREWCGALEDNPADFALDYDWKQKDYDPWERDWFKTGNATDPEGDNKFFWMAPQAQHNQTEDITIGTPMFSLVFKLKWKGHEVKDFYSISRVKRYISSFSNYLNAVALPLGEKLFVATPSGDLAGYSDLDYPVGMTNEKGEFVNIRRAWDNDVFKDCHITEEEFADAIADPDSHKHIFKCGSEWVSVLIDLPDETHGSWVIGMMLNYRDFSNDSEDYLDFININQIIIFVACIGFATIFIFRYFKEVNTSGYTTTKDIELVTSPTEAVKPSDEDEIEINFDNDGDEVAMEMPEVIASSDKE